jgi:hypothetical protein
LIFEINEVAITVSGKLLLTLFKEKSKDQLLTPLVRNWFRSD